MDSDDDASASELNLVDAVFIYLTESRYSEGCSATRKRTIRKKAKKFVVRDGVMYFLKKKKKRQVWIHFDIIYGFSIIMSVLGN